MPTFCRTSVLHKVPTTNQIKNNLRAIVTLFDNTLLLWLHYDMSYLPLFRFARLDSRDDLCGCFLANIDR